MKTTVDSRATRHHGSHRELLLTTTSTAAPMSKIDAIIVPTARRAAAMENAVALAAELGCVVVALCSGYSSPALIAQMARRAGAELVAVDVGHLPPGLLPAFETTTMLEGTIFERKVDTSLKRNLGLLLAGVVGWERIAFLDDDIVVPDPLDLNRAADLLKSSTAAALAVEGFPDNSVVCHAFRDVGGPQDTFIGGGALVIGRSLLKSFFPNVYNEDWFFLLDDQGIGSSAVVGQALQKVYDPFANDIRARSEEFGDCLGEGLFALLDEGGTLAHADSYFFERFIADRRAMISDIIDKVAARADSVEKQRMLVALKAARGRCQLITPDIYVDYMTAWRRDRDMWRVHIEELHARWLPRKRHRNATVQLGLEKALVELGLLSCTRHVTR
ncbi:hypothetical protein ALI22I_27275 [Saccharothrix sp. ALI-22-I]|uniref:hypothetical protein n=1 Tax=Saccharothrix sp. ALI-22-I TaxID=1933778 RepID=UPI00097BF7CF|nr:hypothetical protein [Saccharothrix sp. ALI-22-I]ONI85503.1 hypothetical protein ALI22I_27275 [Saccharothrix sp. ALI-22-I]